MKLCSTGALYQVVFWIQAWALPVGALASDSLCSRALWSHVGRTLCSSQHIQDSHQGLRIERCENETLFGVSPSSEEPPWLRVSREKNLERALSQYARRKWPEAFLNSLRAVSAHVAPYSRWVNVEDAQGNPVAGLSLVTSEMLCVQHLKSGAQKCSGSWRDFDNVLTDPDSWESMPAVDLLALEVLHPGVRVPRIPQRTYEIEGFSFAFNRVYEMRHYFLKHKHPLREAGREEVIFAVLEWMFSDFSNHGEDMFRWPPPGFQVPSLFSYGDAKSILLYSPLALEPSHDWSQASMRDWYPLSATPLEVVESLFLWRSSQSAGLFPSEKALARFKKLRERFFPRERYFTDPRGVVLHSDIFEVRAQVWRQSGQINPPFATSPE